MRAYRKLVISTDAHSTDELKLLRFGVGVARRAWLRREDVLNTLPVDRLLASLLVLSTAVLVAIAARVYPRVVT